DDAAFGARRQVSALGVLAGKAEAHGDDGELRGVVELLARHPHPVAQAVARAVVEGKARGMYAGARRLAGDADPRGGREARDGARLVRQRAPRRPVAADAAGP